MNQNIPHEEHFEDLLMSLKFMDIIPPAGSLAFCNMLEMLAQHINRLVQSNFNMLLALLYRVDVDEDKVRTELKNPGKEETAGHVIARLIIERQNEKLKWRKKYSRQ